MLVSGMIIGSLFTLFVVPSIYVLVARKRAAVTLEEEMAGGVGPRPAQLRPSPV
jgi:hypothetical protein